MLITELKNKDVIIQQLRGKVFVLICHGCKEIHFPERQAEQLLTELTAAGIVTGSRSSRLTLCWSFPAVLVCRPLRSCFPKRRSMQLAIPLRCPVSRVSHPWNMIASSAVSAI